MMLFIHTSGKTHLSTTQMGISRIGKSIDAYIPDTLIPGMYQTNTFLTGHDDEESGTFVHGLTPKEMAATTEEIRAIADVEEDKQALSQAADTIMATAKVGGGAKASSKVSSNRKQAKTSSHRGGLDRSRVVVGVESMVDELKYFH